MSTQRSQKRARVGYSEEFEAPTQSSSTQRVKPQQPESTNWDEEEIQRKVKDVVRYALANEYKKKPMKREEIQKIIGQNGRRAPFNVVLERAGAKLHKVFGLDISELPSTKDKMNQSRTQMKNTQRGGELSTQAIAATQRSGTSRTYILLYNMKEQYRTPEIISQSKEEYKQTGILYVILGLIFLNGQSMTSPDLYGHLNSLKLTKVEERDKYLKGFIAQGYLKMNKKSETSGEDQEYDFNWGVRARLELPTENVVNFLLSFYNLSSEQKKEYETKMYQQGGYQVAKTSRNHTDNATAS